MVTWKFSTGVLSCREELFLRAHPLPPSALHSRETALAGTLADAKQPRIAYGGIGIECSTYGRIRARMEDFTILKDKELTDSKRFAFLKHRPRALPADRSRTSRTWGTRRKGYLRHAQGGFFAPSSSCFLPWTAPFFPMHGAMFVDGMQDADGDWMEPRARWWRADRMSASFDLHGNLSRRVIDNLDASSAFRTAPHIDYEETMQRACDMLIHCLDQQIRPTLVWAPIPALMPGERSSTLCEPGKRLWAQLPHCTSRPGFLDVSLLVGYVWADEPRSTASAGADRHCSRH